MSLTNYQRNTIRLISQQEALGAGMWLGPEEFAQWACKEYGITRAELSDWRRQYLNGA